MLRLELDYVQLRKLFDHKLEKMKEDLRFQHYDMTFIVKDLAEAYELLVEAKD